MPVQLLGAASSSPNDEYPAARCIDGSRMTHCLADYGAPGWVSVRVPPGTRVHSLRLVIYRPWGEEDGLGAHTVYAGTRYGERGCAL